MQMVFTNTPWLHTRVEVKQPSYICLFLLLLIFFYKNLFLTVISEILLG